MDMVAARQGTTRRATMPTRRVASWAQAGSSTSYSGRIHLLIRLAPTRTLAPGRGEGEEDKGDALPAQSEDHRWEAVAFAFAFASRRRVPRCAAPLRPPNAPSPSLRAAPVAQDKFRTYEGPSVVPGQRGGRKVEIGPFLFRTIHNRTTNLGPT